jgi:hypothetical protein
MAAAVLTRSQVLSNSPYLIKRFTLTAGTSGLSVTHGETSSPEICFATNVNANPTATEVSFVHSTATATTIDFEAGSGTFYCYMIWLHEASGGIS